MCSCELLAATSLSVMSLSRAAEASRPSEAWTRSRCCLPRTAKLVSARTNGREGKYQGIGRMTIFRPRTIVLVYMCVLALGFCGPTVYFKEQG